MPEWEKELTASDAQQDTNGSKMPFLRFTKGNRTENHTTWFRNNFFGNLNWINRGNVEEAAILVNVVIGGQNMGQREMRLDHKPARAINHSAPTTHLHYDHQTRAELEALPNPVGRTVRMLRSPTNDYTFVVV